MTNKRYRQEDWYSDESDWDDYRGDRNRRNRDRRPKPSEIFQDFDLRRLKPGKGDDDGAADDDDVNDEHEPPSDAITTADDATAIATENVEDTTALSPQQQFIFDEVVERGQTLFFTGAAGSGKSFLLRRIIAALRQKYPGSNQVAVTASTGIAAVNISGQTLHSWAGVGLGKGERGGILARVQRNNFSKVRWTECRVLVVDEVSMIDNSLFDLLSYIAQNIRPKTDRPFGGLQVVLSGDFFQLPPVARSGPTRFCFEAESWPTVITKCFLLTTVFRQRDERFVRVLNEMRNNELSAEGVRTIKSLERPLVFDDGVEPTELYPLRIQVSSANVERLAALKTEVQVFTADDVITPPEKRHQSDADRDREHKRLQDKLNNWVMATERLELKVGAQVILLVNLDARGGLVNGSVGIVRGFHQGFPVVEFPLHSGGSRSVLIRHNTWPITEQGHVVASRHQIPLLLAWAMSIHKAQGQTIERLRIDLGRSFEYGMAYVALSRGVSLETVQVLKFSRDKVMVHPKVSEFATAHLVEAPEAMKSEVKTKP